MIPPGQAGFTVSEEGEGLRGPSDYWCAVPNIREGPAFDHSCNQGTGSAEPVRGGITCGFRTGAAVCAVCGAGGQGGGRRVSRTCRKWVKFQAFSCNWSNAVSVFSLAHNLSYILRVFVRALCQTHWLWKNNLAGFNLLPPPNPTPPPPFLLPLPSSPLPFFSLLLLLFDLFCVPLRGWEFILFGNFVPVRAPTLSRFNGSFKASVRVGVVTRV